MPTILVAKIKEKGSKGQGCIEYKNEILIGDFKKLALFFVDLESHGGNVIKAVAEFKRLRLSEGFPW